MAFLPVWPVRRCVSNSRSPPAVSLWWLNSDSLQQSAFEPRLRNTCQLLHLDFLSVPWWWRGQIRRLAQMGWLKCFLRALIIGLCFASRWLPQRIADRVSWNSQGSNYSFRKQMLEILRPRHRLPALKPSKYGIVRLGSNASRCFDSALWVCVCFFFFFFPVCHLSV